MKVLNLFHFCKFSYFLSCFLPFLLLFYFHLILLEIKNFKNIPKDIAQCQILLLTMGNNPMINVRYLHKLIVTNK